MGRIEVRWMEFQQMVISSEATPDQMIQTQRAFYSGAGAALGELARMYAAGEDLSGLAEEIETFARDVAEGRA